MLAVSLVGAKKEINKELWYRTQGKGPVLDGGASLRLSAGDRIIGLYICV